jgi:arginine exporter protein ArgO
MTGPKIILAFCLLAVCIIMSLSALGVVSIDVANDSLKRVLLVIGSIGATFTLIYILFSMGKGKSSPEKTDLPESKNSGPKF